MALITFAFVGLVSISSVDSKLHEGREMLDLFYVIYSQGLTYYLPYGSFLAFCGKKNKEHKEPSVAIVEDKVLGETPYSR